MREHESQELPLAAVSLGWLTGKDKQHPSSDMRGGQHAGAWAINALGALRARSRFCSPTPLLESACNARIARPNAEEAARNGPPMAPRRVRFSIPMRMQLMGTAAGGPDLRINLFSLQTGAHVIPLARHTAAHYYHVPASVAGAADLGDKAASMLFLQMMFPDRTPPAIHALAMLGALQAGGQAVRRLLPAKAFRWPGSPLQRATSRKPPTHPSLSQRLRKAAGSTARGVAEFEPPALALLLVATAWAMVHPPSWHLLKCAAATFYISAGYSQTSRGIAVGRIPEGTVAEQAWRDRHKWAAQRVAHLLTDLEPEPPLKPAVDAAGTLSIAIGLQVPGEPTGLGGPNPGTWHSAPEGSQVRLSGSIKAPGGQPMSEAAQARMQDRRKRQRQASQKAAEPQAGPEPSSASLQTPEGLSDIILAAAKVPGREQSSAVVENAGRKLASDPAWANQPKTGTCMGTSFTAASMPTIRNEAELDAILAAARKVASNTAQAAPATADGQSGRRGKAAARRPDATPAGTPRGAAPRPVLDSPSEIHRHKGSQPFAQSQDGAGPSNSHQPSLASSSAASSSQHAPSQPAATHNSSGPLKARAADDDMPALYGAGDHSEVEPTLTPARMFTLSARAIYLIGVFLPFLTLGLFCLLLANWASPTPGATSRIPGESSKQSASAQGEPASSNEVSTRAIASRTDGGEASDRAQELSRQDRSASHAGASTSGRDQAASVAAAVGLDQPGPAPLEARRPRSSLTKADRYRRVAWKMLLVGCRSSGAAFIKWGQWSATRSDIFPEDLCDILSELHDHAPEHSWRASKKEIEKAFGKPVEELFESIDHAPLASGSIAQVHRARVKFDGEVREVVVKVRHPGTAEKIRLDFALLKPLAAASAKVKALKGLSLKESVSQFSNTMTAQTDLRVEAAHLRRCYNNFRRIRQNTTPPFPVPGYETAAVLVETFEPGESVQKYIRQPASFNTQIVALGVDTYLKMLLEDNFVHTDLHPGNILVRTRGGTKIERGDVTDEADLRSKLQLVLLDFGLAEELTPPVRYRFLSFLHSIAGGHGRRAGEHMLQMGQNAKCPDKQGFLRNMAVLFREHCDIQAPGGIDVDKVLKAVLQLARNHEVSIDSGYAALVIGMCIIVGFATSLDPQLNLLDAATPAFFIHNVCGSVVGRLYT